MKQYIFENETRYNSTDLNVVFDRFYTYAKGGSPGVFGSPWEGMQWKFGHEELPVNVSTWSGYDQKEVTDPRRVRTYGPVWNTLQLKVEGPWFCAREKKPIPAMNTGKRRLLILSPATVMETLEPMEALAHTGKGDQLPEVAVVQVLFRASKYMGIEMLPSHHQTGHFTRSDDLRLFRFIQAFVNNTRMSIRIEDYIQTKKDRPSRSTEEKIQRLLHLYGTGGSAKALNYKLWTIRGGSDDYFDSWAKTEAHYRALQKLGAEDRVQRHETLPEVLRRLADEYEDLQKKKEE
mgnify:CR=1 FL=1